MTDPKSPGHVTPSELPNREAAPLPDPVEKKAVDITNAQEIPGGRLGGPAGVLFNEDEDALGAAERAAGLDYSLCSTRSPTHAELADLVCEAAKAQRLGRPDAESLEYYALRWGAKSCGTPGCRHVAISRFGFCVEHEHDPHQHGTRTPAVTPTACRWCGGSIFAEGAVYEHVARQGGRRSTHGVLGRLAFCAPCWERFEEIMTTRGEEPGALARENHLLWLVVGVLRDGCNARHVMKAQPLLDCAEDAKRATHKCLASNSVGTAIENFPSGTRLSLYFDADCPWLVTAVRVERAAADLRASVLLGTRLVFGVGRGSADPPASELRELGPLVVRRGVPLHVDLTTSGEVRAPITVHLFGFEMEPGVQTPMHRDFAAAERGARGALDAVEGGTLAPARAELKRLLGSLPVVACDVCDAPASHRVFWISDHHPHTVERQHPLLAASMACATHLAEVKTQTSGGVPAGVFGVQQFAQDDALAVARLARILGAD